MKILLVLLFILPVYLLSNSVYTPKDIENSYQKGLSFYKKNDFTKSYRYFKNIYLYKLADQKFNFYFGKSAYETGNYENALAAFERVEMNDTSNIQNKLEMARAFSMLKMYQDSENTYRDVLKNPNLPSNIRTDIELALARVSNVQKKSFTYATLKGDILYDSNVNYASLNDYTYDGNDFNKSSAISDTALQIFANITNVYDIGYKNGFAIKNSVSMYLKDYSDTINNKYNIQYFNYIPSLLYKESLFTAELALGLDLLEVNSSKYLSSISLSPQLQYNHTNTLKSLMYIKYQKKEFAQKAQFDLDANRIELAYGLQDILTPRSYLQGNFRYISEKKIRGINTNVSYNQLKFDASYANQFTSKYSFNLHAQISSKKYKEFDAGFNSRRQDIGSSGTLGLTMIIIPNLRFKLSTTYQYVHSNQNRFSYQKYTAVTGLVKTF
ncbi:MAG: hypothetical protein ACI9TV_000009 [Sulfurimonas sp.]|jgi:hypothetical protein|uniref:tetratricopeptide repeat protein n=1 Tax=Sulfurimonas sp. TaxID=2022749 RepID=UPI0039E51249